MFEIYWNKVIVNYNIFCLV